MRYANKRPCVRGVVVAALAATALAAGAMTLSSVAVGASTHAAHHASIQTSATGNTTKTIKFSGKYAGIVTLVVNASTSATTVTSIAGKGTATIVGKGSVAGSGGSAATSQECPIPIHGTAHITGPGGKVTFRVLTSKSLGCSSGSSGKVTVTFHGTAVVTGATGKAKGLSGTISFHGSFPLPGTTGRESGKYTATLSGTLHQKS
jgi:hypothetical protein